MVTAIITPCVKAGLWKKVTVILYVSDSKRGRQICLVFEGIPCSSGCVNKKWGDPLGIGKSSSFIGAENASGSLLGCMEYGDSLGWVVRQMRTRASSDSMSDGC